MSSNQLLFKPTALYDASNCFAQYIFSPCSNHNSGNSNAKNTRCCQRPSAKTYYKAVNVYQTELGFNICPSTRPVFNFVRLVSPRRGHRQWDVTSGVIYGQSKGHIGWHHDLICSMMWVNKELCGFLFSFLR